MRKCHPFYSCCVVAEGSQKQNRGRFLLMRDRGFSRHGPAEKNVARPKHDWVLCNLQVSAHTVMVDVSANVTKKKKSVLGGITHCRPSFTEFRDGE